jgi:hypothetical protein
MELNTYVRLQVLPPAMYSKKRQRDNNIKMFGLQTYVVV